MEITATVISRLSEILNESKKLVCFSGAGISCPSGIPDFRSACGLYNQKTDDATSPEEIVSHHYFIQKPKQFYRFYREKMLFPDAVPNAAHSLFAALQTDKRHVTVVTQNIDGLHTAAGSTDVCELHGSVHRNFCTRCGRFFDLRQLLAAQDADGIPRCPDDGAVIKPDVVLYEEPLDGDTVEHAVTAISEADTMVIVGTSLVVYPAASFIRYFSGKHLILVNLSETEFDSMAELAVYADCAKLAKKLLPLL